ncbi:MAG: hypothetical protein Q9223_005370 [Gallowayella weberi]
MNVNKKLGRFKQWAGERMGGEAKTSVSDDFKSLEVEMNLRHEGMERLQKSMTTYVKTLSKRNEGDDKEKSLPVTYLGSTMVRHGEDFEDDSEFGQCLISMGRTNERVGRIQETYVAQATSSWLESLERSLAQMKDYQAARKKLENRRLAYDTSLAKMQKAKREDFRVEEELRIQKAKYEETSEDVYRRMQDIKEAEADSITDLGAFLDAELKYYDRCRDVLLQLKEAWPAGQGEPSDRDNCSNPRSRSNTAHTFADRYKEDEPPMLPPERPSIRSSRTASSHVLSDSPHREAQDVDYGYSRPSIHRTNTFEGPSQLHRDASPIPLGRTARVPSDSLTVRTQRSQLRPAVRMPSGNEGPTEPSDESVVYSSPDRSYDERSASPATSYGSAPSRTASYSTLNAATTNGKKQAPPPPPSRAKKPPPPPPPMKRSALSTNNVSTLPALTQGQPFIPPNFTKAQMMETYTKLQQMQKQGVRQDDPEFIKTVNIMQAARQQAALTNQRKAAQQQQQQQQAQQQQQQQQAQQHPLAKAQESVNGVNGNTTNGVPPAVPSGQTSSASPPATDAAANVSTGAAALPTKPQAAPSNNFSTEQMQTLRNQILAFKLLSKNLPIPPNVQQQLFATQPNKRRPSIPQAVAAAGQVLEEVRASQTQVTEKHGPHAPAPPHFYKSFVPPRNKIERFISYADHGPKVASLWVPSLLPPGVDVDRVREDRERVIYNRIQARKTELENLKVNLGSWDTTKSDTPKPDDSLKLKALIEYKMLTLLPKQRALRQQISREMLHYDNLAQTANRSMYRRVKKQSLREARLTEKLEKQQRDVRETKEKKKHIDHLQAIARHREEIEQNARAQKARVQKLGRLMQQQHQQIEKEEQKRVERTAKQRLQALKANDEETYLKLLGQAKDSRISHLLKQTDGFLKHLAASVKQQQRNSAEHYGDANMPEDDVSASDDDEPDAPKVDYYEVAHKIKEEIKVQPGLLIGGTLKEYQVKGLQWMISLYNNNLNGILADEMGLGKTIQTISLLTYLIEKKKQNGPFLVIVPLSTLTNWNLEFEKWAPSIARIVYKGNPAQRKTQQGQIRYGHFQVLLTTYEYIIKDRPILSKIKWVHMIVDEGHRMKNANSKLSLTLTQYYHTRFRLILTGTPLQNNLPELWALLNFVLPTIFKSVKSFDEWFNTPFANTGGQDKIELTEEEQLLVIRRLHKVLRPFLLRRLKKDVEKDLPDKQERVIKCRFSALQAKLYKQLVTSNKISVSDGKGGIKGMKGLSNMLMQLRKLCNHPFVFEEVENQMNPEKLTNDLLWRTAGKFELLDRVMPKFQATGHRVLMFFQMTQIMNIMEDFLRLRGMQYLRLDGGTKSDDRSELLAQFNAPNSPYFCFLLSTRAGGLGLNLQTADTVIIYDSDWNPHQDLQAQDRAHRIGQKNEVRILRLISSNSVEEKILERANYKLDMDGKVIQAGKFDNKSTNEERDALLRTLLDSAEAAEQLAEQEEMDDDDLNQIMARTEDELNLFQKMDEERLQDPDYGPGRPLPRLMAEDELPQIYLREDNPAPEEVEEYAGRGARERTRVKYDDGLTEEQWAMAVDNDEDTLEDAIARKNATVEKRRSNKDKKAKRASGLDISPETSRESSEAPVSKKRNRGKANGFKRKAEEEVEEPAAKRKRGAPRKGLDHLSNSQRNTLQKILDKVYNHLKELEVEIPPQAGESDDDDDDPPTRLIIDPFMKLVPKTQYPDYYMIIKQPISMDMIKKKINKEEYSNLRDFRNDIRLLCNNARTYNEDGSVIFQDANDIEAACVARLKQETEDQPEFQDFEDSNSTPADGRSTAGVSNVGTPMPSGNGVPKLKLTFNGNRNGFANGGMQSDEE